MDKQEYWEGRYAAEGKIWGESPSQSAHDALKLFLANNVKSVLVPGSGYGRNTKLFSTAGLDVTGIEISETAYKMAGNLTRGQNSTWEQFWICPSIIASTMLSIASMFCIFFVSRKENCF